MPVSQTVLINIIVRGGVANITSLETPLQNVQKAAAKTTSSIDNIATSMQRSATQAAAISSQLSLPFNNVIAAANAATVAANATQASFPFANILSTAPAAVNAINNVSLAQTKAARDALYITQATAQAEDRMRTKAASDIASANAAQIAEVTAVNAATIAARERAAVGEISVIQQTAKAEDKLRTNTVAEITRAKNAETAIIQQTANAEDRLRTNTAAQVVKAKNAELGIIQSTAKAEDTLRANTAAEVLKAKNAEMAIIQQTALAESRARTEIAAIIRRNENAGMAVIQQTANAENKLRSDTATVVTRAKNAEMSIIQQTAQIEDRARTATAAGVVKAKNAEMAIIQQTAQAEDRMRTKSITAQEEMGAAGSRTVATLQKAMISMIGILIVWNLFITLPEKIISGLFAIAEAAIRSTDEIQRSILATAGLIAMFVDFGPNIATSFESAVVMAGKLQITFAQLAAKSLASAQDIQMGFQAFVSRGGIGFVKTIDDAARVAALLTNATIALTGGLQKERQIRTEIDALMAGQARAGAVVARLIKAQVGDLNVWLAQQREAGTLLQSLEKMFGGLVAANEKLAMTPTGLINSIKGSAEIINNISMASGALKPLIEFLVQIRDSLSAALNEFASPVVFSASSEQIMSIFTSLSVSIEMAVKSFHGFLLALTQSDTIVEALSRVATGVMRITVFIGSLFDAMAAVARGDAKNVADAFSAMLAVNIAVAQQRLGEIRASIVKAMTTEDVTGVIKPRVEVATDVQEKAIERMIRDIQVLQAGDNEVLKIEIKRAEKAQELVVAFAGAPQHLRQALALNAELARQEELALRRKTERTVIQDLQNQTNMLIAGMNEYARLGESIAEKERSILEKLVGQTEERRKALALIKELSIAQMLEPAQKGVETARLALIRETKGASAELAEKMRLDIEGIHRGFEAISKQTTKSIGDQITDSHTRVIDAQRIAITAVINTDAMRAPILAANLNTTKEELNTLRDIKNVKDGINASDIVGLNSAQQEAAIATEQKKVQWITQARLDAQRELDVVKAKVTAASSRSLFVEEGALGTFISVAQKQANAQIIAAQKVYNEKIALIDKLAAYDIMIEKKRAAEREKDATEAAAKIQKTTSTKYVIPVAAAAVVSDADRVKNAAEIVAYTRELADAEAKVITLRKESNRLEQEAVAAVQGRKLTQEYLNVTAQIERYNNRLNAVAEVEAEERAVINKLSIEYRDMGVGLYFLIGQYRLLYEEKRKQAKIDMENAANRAMVDRTRELTTVIEDATLQYMHFRGTADSVNIAQIALTAQIIRNTEAIIQLRNQEVSSIAEYDAVTARIKMLEKANYDATQQQLRFNDTIARAQMGFERFKIALQLFIRGQITGMQLLKAAGTAVVDMFISGIGPAITQMFQAFRSGESVLGAFLHFIGQILIQLGEMCVSMGILEVAMSFTLAGRLAGASLTAGLALIVAGVAAIAAGVALGGAGAAKSSSSAASGGTTSSNQNQTRNITMEPYFQRQNTIIDRLNTTINKLDNTMNKFNTKSAGLVVFEGAGDAATRTKITQVVAKQLQTTTALRRGLAGAILGET